MCVCVCVCVYVCLAVQWEMEYVVPKLMNVKSLTILMGPANFISLASGTRT